MLHTLYYKVEIFFTSYSSCSLKFISTTIYQRENCKPKGQVMHLGTEYNKVINLMVSKYSELSVTKLWDMVKSCDYLLLYLPNLEHLKLTERSFIMGTLWETPVFPLGIAALRRRNPGENLVVGSIPLKGQILIPLNRLLNFWSRSDEFEKQARTRKGYRHCQTLPVSGS